ncbi:hypothetical protein EV663_12512 [Rhodovulum bhavnagarense]|uniref:Uncharacterized protein n=1 Tax=Rhodovulum bhavnagarense TaxID=992286 RepID=A0A4R2RH05_9RHOB|nr:hypothetical protein EV663_12512 [Rhodovulum bhavnagarense]
MWRAGFPGMKRGRAADGVFDKGGVDVDAPICSSRRDRLIGFDLSLRKCLSMQDREASGMG